MWVLCVSASFTVVKVRADPTPMSWVTSLLGRWHLLQNQPSIDETYFRGCSCAALASFGGGWTVFLSRKAASTCCLVSANSDALSNFFSNKFPSRSSSDTKLAKHIQETGKRGKMVAQSRHRKWTNLTVAQAGQVLDMYLQNPRGHSLPHRSRCVQVKAPSLRSGTKRRDSNNKIYLIKRAQWKRS